MEHEMMNWMKGTWIGDHWLAWNYWTVVIHLLLAMDSSFVVAESAAGHGEQMVACYGSCQRRKKGDVAMGAGVVDAK